MIALAIIIALSAAILATLAVFWKKIVNWIKKAAEKIAAALGVVVTGTKTFIIKTKEGFQNRSKYYNQNNVTGAWEETFDKKEITDINEIPANILAKARAEQENVELQTTDYLRTELAAVGVSA
jgi:hypothetical protein